MLAVRNLEVTYGEFAAVRGVLVEKPIVAADTRAEVAQALRVEIAVFAAAGLVGDPARAAGARDVPLTFGAAAFGPGTVSGALGAPPGLGDTRTS